MIHLDLSKQLAPVDGLAGVVVEGKAGFEAGDLAEKSLPSFKQLLQTGVGRLARAEGLAGDGAASTVRALRAKFPAGEPADRSMIDAGSAPPPASADGTASQDDAVELEGGLKGGLAGEKATAASRQEEDAEHTDEQIFEMIWPGLSLRLASRTALQSTDAVKEERSDAVKEEWSDAVKEERSDAVKEERSDAVKEERSDAVKEEWSDAAKEERSPPAVFMAAPDDAPVKPVPLTFGPAKPFLAGVESVDSVDSVDRSPIPGSVIPALETRIGSDLRVTLAAGGEPVVVVETEGSDDFLSPEVFSSPVVADEADAPPGPEVAAPSQLSPLGFAIPILQSTTTPVSGSAATAAPSIEATLTRAGSEAPINPAPLSVTGLPPATEPLASPPLTKSAESPLVKKSPASPVAKESPASPLVKESPAPAGVRSAEASPVVKGAESPLLAKESPASPVAKEPPASPVAKEPPASPVAKEPPASPVAKEPPESPLVKESPAPAGVRSAEASPLVKESPAPAGVRSAEASPLVKESPAPAGVRSAEASPLVKESPAPAGVRSAEASPLVKESSASPVVKESPAPAGVRSAEASPLVKESPAPAGVRSAEASPLVKESPASPLVKGAESPLVKDAESPLVKGAESPLVKESPASPVAKESPASPVAKESPASPVAKESPASLVAKGAESPPLVKESPAPAGVRSAEASPLVKESPAPAGVRSTESPLLSKEPTPLMAARAALESHSVVAKTSIAETAATRSVTAETLFRPAPVIEPAARLASQPPDRVVRLEARGGGRPATMASPNTTLEEGTEPTIDKNRIVGRERAPFVDASPPRTTHERPSSQPRLAEPFSQTESSGLSSRPASLPEPRLATVGPTLTAPRALAGADRPTPPANPDSTPFAIIQPGRSPSPAEAVAVAEGLRSESLVAGEPAASRAMAADAATADRPTIQPTGPMPAAPARPDAGMPSTFPQTAPEIVNLLQKNWGWMLGRQLQWMVDNRLHEAKINISPPHLGPLEVRVSLHHNQANVMFFSHETAVREALESAMPRLRELLDGQGLQLNQTQVSDQSRQQSGLEEQAARQRDGGSSASTGKRDTDADDVDEPQSPSRRPQGMVDHYV
ncbi:MAG: flagellar hook-length control protein FliK [Candidatus Competibacteraceae bacterium]|nr:flagellar hook-length control protein FliK [Candidatus Competibacteraceae bacterium]